MGCRETTTSDYCILALEILETYGSGVTTADFGQSWLEMLPYWRVYTAERAAYRNLVLGSANEPSGDGQTTRTANGSGRRFGPTCWAGCIRGRPEAAAALAYRDAALSHVKNGIYGEMWGGRPPSLPLSAWTIRWTRCGPGMDQIPASSRLHAALTNTLAWSEEVRGLAGRLGAGG